MLTKKPRILSCTKTISTTAISLLLLHFSSAALAENTPAETVNLSYHKGIFSTRIYNGSESIKRSDLKRHLQSDKEALVIFNKSTAPYNTAKVFAIIGGFAIGAALGEKSADSETELKSGQIGAGFIAIGIAALFGNASGKHVRSSIDIFNANKSSSTQLTPVQFSKTLAPNGIGFKLAF